MIYSLETAMENLQSQMDELESFKCDLEWKIENSVEQLRETLQESTSMEAGSIMEEMPHEVESILGMTDIESEISDTIIETLRSEL